MSNYQQTTIIGRVGKDAEMRYTGSGQAVTAFSVAVSKQYKNAAGEQVKNTNWFRVSAWGKSAEICNQYVKKGMLVQVVGELKGDENGNPKVYTKKDGTAAASFELTAFNVLFLSRVEGDQPPVEDESPF